MCVRAVLVAFAKLNGSYQAIEGGWVDDALQELTGGVSERLSWQDAEVRRSALDGSLFERCVRYAQSGYLMGAGSPVGKSDSEDDASAQGIVQSHAYSVLGLLDADGHQLIHVRNPWYANTQHNTHTHTQQRNALQTCQVHGLSHHTSTVCALSGVARSGAATGATTVLCGRLA